jgi:hypothetical protein
MLVIIRTWFMLLLLTSSSYASIPTVIIDSDVAVISSLNTVLISNIPIAYLRAQSILCEKIDSCRPSVIPRLNEYEMYLVNRHSAILSDCTKDDVTVSFMSKCLLSIKYLTIFTHKDFDKFVNVLNTTRSEIQSFDIYRLHTCPSNEAYAMVCGWTKQKKAQSYERKNLVYVAQHYSDNEYQTFVQVTKKNLRLLINAMKKVFPMQNGIKTISSSAKRSVQASVTLLVLLLSVIFC